MKRVIKVISFIFILEMIILAASFALIPSSYMRVVFHDVRTAVGDDAYDMIILGQSRGETNINPYILDDYIDFNSYNMSRRILRMSDMYYITSECNENNQLRAIVLDVDHSYWLDPQISYYNDAYLLPNLSNINNRIDYFMRYTLSADYRVVFSRFSIQGMEDLKNSGDRIRAKLSSEYREYSMDAVYNKDHDHIYVGRGYHQGIAKGNGGYGTHWNQELIDDSMKDDIRRLVKYCNENEIRIVAIHDPVPHGRFSDADHYEMRDYFCQTLGEMGVDYLDFNFVNPNYLTWTDDNFSDGEGHMMGTFADKYSELLGKVLNEYFANSDISYYFENEVNS